MKSFDRGGWLALLALLVLGLAGVFYFVEPPAPASAPRPAAAPAPPVPALPVLPGDLAEDVLLAQSLPWGEEAKAAAAAEEALPRWMIAGSFATSDGRRRVTLYFENDARPMRHLGVGDHLPDGRKIRAIERFRVRLRDPASGHEAWYGLAEVGPQ